MIDLTPIIEIVISLAVAAITVFLIPYIKGKLSQSQLDRLRAAAEIAVMAAEEAARSNLINKDAKYEYAVAYLEKNGFTLNSDEMKKVIDAAVWELINHLKEA